MIARLLICPDVKKIQEDIQKTLRLHLEGVNVNHPDVLYFKTGNKLGITEARAIKEYFSLKPYSIKGRVVILEDVSQITIESQNALLKTIEELPSEAILILGTSSDANLLPTILSRCETKYLDSANNKTTYPAKYTEDLEKLLSCNITGRFEYVEKLKEKEEFLFFLTYTFREMLYNPKPDVAKLEVTKFLNELLQAEKWAKQNVNIRAILEYLMLVIPGRSVEPIYIPQGGFLMATNKYSAEQIQVLEGLEPVRKRPGMYIGSTDLRGLHHLIKETVDNGIDEALAGYAKNIWIILHEDNYVTVADDGRGIPVDIHPKVGKSALEVIMTTLHAGGKFGDGGYKVSTGLHGVGVSAVNALSDYMRTVVRRDNKEYFQEYERGVAKSKVAEVKDQSNVPFKSTFKWPAKTGTLQTFLADKTIFSTITPEFEKLEKQLKQVAYLVAGIFFHFYDERTGQERHFYFQSGLA
ncbi:ATP-binding protein, partial [Patescibacteria group bacterium]|nr:ATP-binding protein [Patescibacteria group bacterium]